MFMCAPIVEDAMSEFLAETPEEAFEEVPARIIQVVPATFLDDRTPGASQFATTRSRRRRNDRVLILLARTANVLRGSVSRTARWMYATAHTGSHFALVLTRIAARNVRSGLRGVSGRLTGVWRTTRLFCSTADTQRVLRMIARVQAIRTARIESAHTPMLHSRVAAFGGGIAIGVVVMWSFDLQPRINVVTAERTLAPSETTPVFPDVALTAKAFDVSPQNLTREPTLRVVSTSGVKSSVAADASSYPERRPTMARPAAADSPGAVSRGVATSSVPRFRGTLAIDSVTKGARVFVNGEPVGVTPLVLKNLPAGSRAVRVEAPGYRIWSASVQVTANRQTRVMAKADRVIADVPNDRLDGR
jgi:PEGA domain